MNENRDDKILEGIEELKEDRRKLSINALNLLRENKNDVENLHDDVLGNEKGIEKIIEMFEEYRERNVMPAILVLMTSTFIGCVGGVMAACGLINYLKKDDDWE